MVVSLGPGSPDADQDLRRRNQEELGGDGLWVPLGGLVIL